MMNLVEYHRLVVVRRVILDSFQDISLLQAIYNLNLVHDLQSHI